MNGRKNDISFMNTVGKHNLKASFIIIAPLLGGMTYKMREGYQNERSLFNLQYASRKGVFQSFTVSVKGKEAKI